MKPPFPYYGGKLNLAGRIVGLLPEHAHYVEPYAGSLSVLLEKPPALMETVNDLDHELVTFWRVLREREAELLEVCALSPHARSDYEAIRDQRLPPAGELEVARRTWVQLTQGRAGTRRPNERTGWRFVVAPSYGMSMPDLLDSYLSRFPAAVRRLRRVSLECRPALELIRDYGSEPSALIYVDPPYVRSARTSSGYRYEMTDDDHRALAEVLHTCAAAVVLSGYPSPLYDLELFPGWHRTDLAGHTSQGGAGKVTTEALWSNRPLGAQDSLFSVSALGGGP